MLAGFATKFVVQRCISRGSLIHTSIFIAVLRFKRGVFLNRQPFQKILHHSFEKKQGIVVECAVVFNETKQRFNDGDIIRICQTFGPISESRVRRYWRERKRQKDSGILSPDIAIRLKGNCGRHSKLAPDIIYAFRSILQVYAHVGIIITIRRVRLELKKAGFVLGKLTFLRYQMKLKSRKPSRIE